ncbi:hypothetical protein TKK_0011320 [Trichogramma kaykai]
MLIIARPYKPRKPAQLYTCPKCKKCYAQRRSFKIHCRYDCFSKPNYRCPYCQFASKRTCNVYRHVRVKHAKFQVGYIDLKTPDVIKML